MDIQKNNAAEKTFSLDEPEKKAVWHSPVFVQLKANSGTESGTGPGGDGITQHS